MITVVVIITIIVIIIITLLLLVITTSIGIKLIPIIVNHGLLRGGTRLLIIVRITLTHSLTGAEQPRVGCIGGDDVR